MDSRSPRGHRGAIAFEIFVSFQGAVVGISRALHSSMAAATGSVMVTKRVYVALPGRGATGIRVRRFVQPGVQAVHGRAAGRCPGTWKIVEAERVRRLWALRLLAVSPRRSADRLQGKAPDQPSSLERSMLGVRDVGNSTCHSSSISRACRTSAMTIGNSAALFSAATMRIVRASISIFCDPLSSPANIAGWASERQDRTIDPSKMDRYPVNHSCCVSPATGRTPSLALRRLNR